jgi:predicted Zn finger-like uncharacterized protein
MIITCKACNTSFNLDDKMLKPTGSKVRCSVCASVFTVFPDQASSSESKDDREESKAALTTAMGIPEDTDDDTVDEIDEAVSKALDEDLEDLNLDAGETGGDNEATMIANLDDDDDLELDLSSEPTEDDDLSATVVADLDDDDFDLSFDEKPDSDETLIVDLEGDDLDLDIPAETSDDDDSVTMVITDLDEDESIDLDDDDLSLELEEDDDSGVSLDKEPMETGDDLDLSLDLEIDEAVPSTEVPVAESDDIEMDDLSLDFDLEADTDEEAKPASDKDVSADDEMELELELDLEDDGLGEEKPKTDGTVLEDDLDMTSLEEMFDEESADDSATMVADADELPELDLELYDEPTKDETDQRQGADETLADLELELDEEGKTESSGGGVEDSELDLSEIEKMLEEPQAGGQKVSVPEQDLDLDIEASLESEKWMSESGNDQIVADEELDLSELEQVLEDVDTDAGDDTIEDQELELDLSDDNDNAKAAETVAIDNDLEFDLSDFEDDVPAKSANKVASEQPADMELEFEMDEGGSEDQALADEGLEETVAMADAVAAAAPTDQEDVADETLDTVPPAAPASAPEPKPEKKETSSKSLVFLVLIIVILGGAGYGSYYFLNKSNIEIPFISDYLKPKDQDPGNIKLATHDINSRFIDNTNVGKLFVITGKVKNGYTENRGMVTITGKIFKSGKVEVHEETVYCGNVMSDLELSNLEWDKIQARLANRLGDNRSNVKIEPGKSIPFMVVFSSLPDDLEEFTIEVAGSTSLK